MAGKSVGKGQVESVTIYHNPKCGTSRKVLAALREKGLEPHVVEYLKEPPGRAQLVKLMKAAGLEGRDLIRSKEQVFADLGLDLVSSKEKDLIDAMADHPILMNRPIVVTEKGVRLCRPADKLDEIL